MSDIDLRDPQVLRNWLTSQMQEGRGTFQRRDQVLVFKNDAGSEFVVPDGVAKDLEAHSVVAPVAKPKAEAKAKAKPKAEAVDSSEQ